MRTDVGGYGILPYPRSQQHLKTSVSSVDSVGELTQPTICVDQCNPWENYIPTEPTEPTEASCREEPPTDITDTHRLGGYGILPYPRSQQHPKTSVSSVNSVGELMQPPICVDQCNPWENYIPQNPRNAQKFLVEKGLPQIARIYTDVGGYGILPYPRSH